MLYLDGLYHSCAQLVNADGASPLISTPVNCTRSDFPAKQGWIRVQGLCCAWLHSDWPNPRWCLQHIMHLSPVIVYVHRLVMCSYVESLTVYWARRQTYRNLRHRKEISFDLRGSVRNDHFILHSDSSNCNVMTIIPAVQKHVRSAQTPQFEAAEGNQRRWKY